MIDHFLPKFDILKDALDEFYNVSGYETVDFGQLKSLGFYVLNKNGIAVYYYWHFEVDSFEQRVAKTLVGARIGNQVGMKIKVPQGINLFAFRIVLAHLANT